MLEPHDQVMNVISAVALVALIATIGIVLSGCSVHLDIGSPTPPTTVVYY